MKQMLKRQKSFLSVSVLSVFVLVAVATNWNNERKHVESCNNPHLNHVCVMKTIFGLESNSASTFTTSDLADAAVKRGLSWIEKAQTNEGGWGAGTHARQDILDPHAVPSDPATTALVAMAL